MVKVSIYEIVVGDIVPLRIGDQVSNITGHGNLIRSRLNHYLFVSIFWVIQVPADGVLVSGHSLAIDESSMTGESKIVSVPSSPIRSFIGSIRFSSVYFSGAKRSERSFLDVRLQGCRWRWHYDGNPVILICSIILEKSPILHLNRRRSRS